MIVITGVPTGYMRTEQMYENFIIECDWQHMKEGGNSGVFIWGDGIPAMGTGYTRGIEVQVLDLGYETHKGENEWFTTHGDIFPIWGATMTPWGRSRTAARASAASPPKSAPSPRPSGTTTASSATTGEIRLSVNGKEVTVGKDCVPRKGLHRAGERRQRSALQEHPHQGTAVHERDTGADGESLRGLQGALQRQGLHRLESPRGEQALWRADGSHFVAEGGQGRHKPTSWTDKDYGTSTLVADWRFTHEAGEEDWSNKIAPDGEERVIGADGKPEQIEVEEPADSGIYLRGEQQGAGEHLGAADRLRRDSRLPCG